MFRVDLKLFGFFQLIPHFPINDVPEPLGSLRIPSVVQVLGIARDRPDYLSILLFLLLCQLLQILQTFSSIHALVDLLLRSTL